VVKEENPNPRKIQVQVVGEDESSSAIRPTRAGELVAGDHVAGTGAIFFFKR
jgi:hypothetical protein